MKRIGFTAFTCLLSILPFFAYAGCDTGLQDMYVYVNIENFLSSDIACSVTSTQGGSWLTSTSVWDDMGQYSHPSATACSTGKSDQTVGDTITCWNLVKSGGILTKSTEIGSFTFSHTCSWGLNHVGDGSCSGSYEDNVTNNSMSGYNVDTTYVEGYSNPHALTVDADIYSS